MKNIEELKDIIGRFYSEYSAITGEVEDILLSCGASEDDSSDEGYFAGMTDSQIESCYNKLRDLIKYRHENINPDYFTEDTLVDFDLQDLVLSESFSIYEQMNKIDDEESLNKKHNVRTLKDVEKLQEAEAPKSNRGSIKTRVNELIDMIDWSKWEKFTSTGDDTEPEVRKTKAIDDGIRVYVYLGWDYGHRDDLEDYVKAVNEKFEAFAAIVRKQEPSWSVKLVKSHGSRGVTWTNYWAQVTVKN